MKQKFLISTVIAILLCFVQANAQCSLCAKTASQLGEGPASALNSAIVYLMISPYVIIGYVGYRWWKKEKRIIKEEQTS